MKMHFTKMLSVCCAIMLGAFLTTETNGQCLIANNGQWPGTTYVPTCDGVANSISGICWTDEYSVVAVTAGEEYTFSSSVATDYLTISSDGGATAAAFGTGSVTWISTLNGDIRFYSHNSSLCDGEQISRDRFVQCGDVPIECLNPIQYPPTPDDLSTVGGDLVVIDGCSYYEEHAVVTGVPVGEDIEFTIEGGGYITVREGTFDGPVIGQGFSPLTVPGNGLDLFAHWTLDSQCTQEAGTCYVSTVQCTSCPLTPPTDGLCYNTTFYPSFNVENVGENGSELATIASCSYQEEYSQVTGVPVGEDIEFAIVGGGYITVREGAPNGPVVANGFSPLTVIGASGDDLFPHWTVDETCLTAAVCVATTVQCTSCATDCVDGNFGDPCDDGNPDTTGETIQPDCSCGGGITVPDNDTCADVTSALQCGVTIEATTAGATEEAVDPSGCGFSYLGSPSVWYAFSANGSNNYTVTVDPGATSTSWDGVLYVYSGACGSLVEVGCSDTTVNGGSEAVELLAPAAGVYYVLVYDYFGSDSFAITLDCESSCANPFPPMDESSLATTVSGTGVLTQWAAVPGQIGCRVQLRFAGGLILGNQTVNGATVSSFNIPYGPLTANTDYEWRVRCGCQASPLVANPYSTWQPFTTPGGPGSAISSFPSPTEGQSNVTFTVAEEGYTTLEVFDMSGRLVDAIFTGTAQANNDYRFEFDGSALPNGVYIYRLTTETEVVNDKFMIAK